MPEKVFSLLQLFEMTFVLGIRINQLIMKNIFTTCLCLMLLGLSQLPAQTYVISVGEYELEGEAAFLGVRSNSISKEKAKKLGFSNNHGDYVTKVISNTAAERAGIQPFDYIFKLDEKETTASRRLGDLLDYYKPGDQVKISYYRKGKVQTVNATLGTRADADYTAEKKEKPFLGVSQVGTSSANSELDGVSVSIVSNSTAEAMGMRRGDMITKINGFTILDWSDITTAVNTLKVGETVKVDYFREGASKNSSGVVKSYNATKPATTKVEEKSSKGGNYAFLGVYSDEVNSNKAKILGFENPYGSYVSGVIDNTAAEKGGLQPLDYIYGVDEYRVGENQRLTGILKKYRPGETATIHLIRKGATKEMKVTFTDRSVVGEKEKLDKCQEPFFGITEVARRSGSKYGIKINVVSNSTAENLGLEDEDILLEINGHKMVDWSDVGNAIDALSPGDIIKVRYERNGKQLVGSKAIMSYAKTKNCANCDCNEGENEWEFNYDIKGSVPDLSDFNDMTFTLNEVNDRELSQIAESLSIDLPSSQQLNVQNVRVALQSTKGGVTLGFKLSQKGDTVVRIYTESGRQIYEYQLNGFTGDFEDQINVAKNGSGIYYLVIRQNDQVRLKKLDVMMN